MIYILELSTKQKIPIDGEDYKKFIATSGTGNFIKLKQGIVNPSFVVSIIPQGDKQKKEVEGYIDEETGKFIITSDRLVPTTLEDTMTPPKVTIQERVGVLKSAGELLNKSND